MFLTPESEPTSNVASMVGSSSCAPSFPEGEIAQRDGHQGAVERVSANAKAASAPSDILLQHLRCSLPWVAAQQSVDLRKMRTVGACERSRIRASSASDGSTFRAFGDDVSENQLEAIDVAIYPIFPRCLISAHTPALTPARAWDLEGGARDTDGHGPSSQ
eukprot:2032183-Pleurochrysis_carterae.AAC.1